DPSDTYTFPDSPDSFSYPSATRSGFPWKIAAILFVSAVAVALTASVFLFIFNSVVVAPPEQVVRYFYEALNRQDYELAAQYIDPESGGMVNPNEVLNGIADVLKQAFTEGTGTEIPIPLDFGLRFQNLEYTRL